LEGQRPEPCEAAALERVLEHRIAQRTWGRIRQLRVEMTSSRVTVHGFTPLYYIKQLALQVVLDTLGAGDSRTVEIDIQLGPVVHSEARPCRAQSLSWDL
jgi:hypothetical protein